MSFLSEQISIGFLGQGGSYTEMAKDKFCEKYEINTRQETLRTIKEVVEYVDNNQEALGVLPIENSIEGTVRESIDNLIKTKNKNIRILSEFEMPIKHCLISKTTELYSITGIISHPQALSRCSDFIYHQMPLHLNIVEASSTEEAARKLSDYNLTYAAIGSPMTAEIFNLNILKDDINDEPNVTRFALIGEADTPKTGHDTTSVAFSTKNEAGALLNILEIFKRNSINLSYIDSRPSKSQDGGYTFLVDFDGHLSDEIVKKTVEEIQSNAEYFRLIGSYERW